MTNEIRWPTEYAALIKRIPDLIRQSRLTVGGFSTCIDVYLPFRDALGPLSRAADKEGRGATLLAELTKRALNGVGGEMYVDWPEGGNWIDSHITGRQAIGGTNAQAAYMLSLLGAQALIALEDRSAGQLALLHPETLVASGNNVVPVSSVPPGGTERRPHYIFEFTAGEMIADNRVPRSSRTIVRFDHKPLQRDAAFEDAVTAQALDVGAGVLCGFNEVPLDATDSELAYAAGVASAWRRSGLELIHVELGDFPSPELRQMTIERLLPVVTSLGLSLSELVDLTGTSAPTEMAASRLAEEFDLHRVCVHADDWALAVTRGDAEREREALAMGCLLASTRAATGYFGVPDRLPDGARFRAPPLLSSLQRDGWSIVCCPAPYLEKPVATIGLGDTFLAGTLLVLGGSVSTPARAQSRHSAVSGSQP